MVSDKKRKSDEQSLIRVDDAIADKIKELRIVPEEHMNNVIKRLLIKTGNLKE